MPRITLDNIAPATFERLTARAAQNGRSVEDEARDILLRALAEPAGPPSLAVALRTRIAHSDRIELELPEREPMREPPRFDDRAI